MSMPKGMFVAAHGEAYEQHMVMVKAHHMFWIRQFQHFSAEPTHLSSKHASNASAFEFRIYCNISASLNRCRAQYFVWWSVQAKVEATKVEGPSCIGSRSSNLSQLHRSYCTHFRRLQLEVTLLFWAFDSRNGRQSASECTDIDKHGMGNYEYTPVCSTKWITVYTSGTGRFCTGTPYVR